MRIKNWVKKESWWKMLRKRKWMKKCTVKEENKKYKEKELD